LIDAGGVDAGGVDAGGVDGGVAFDGGTCWPFDDVPTAQLRASPKKVFAHYFSPFPLSIDNLPVATDYYAVEYLRPTGEFSAHLYCGGYLKDRPLSPPPWPMGTDINLENAKIEIRRAIRLGLDGFAYDVLETSPTNIHWIRLDRMLAAAAAVDPGFKIMLIADMTSIAPSGSDAVATTELLSVIAAFGNHPSTLHLPDGRIVLAAFGAERRPASFWSQLLTTLAMRGTPAALMPMTIPPWSAYPPSFAGVPLFGAATWGPRAVSGVPSMQVDADVAHDAGLVWMAAVAPQDSRPKDLGLIESDAAEAFLELWNTTLVSNADWVQLVTWNDYSENTHISPSVQTGTAFYDLSAWFIRRMKLGSAPIVRDALYWFHRPHSMNVALAPFSTQQPSAYVATNGPAVAANRVELVALLTAPATLRIDLGGQRFERVVGAGLQRFDVALIEGTPTFSIVRNGTVVLQATSATPISNTINWQNPLYHAGAFPTCPVVW
ncbi:MAG: endo-1,3-alpha-glucanase family glycosylhydrolase, partial [Myxococcaceae bacterium]